MVNNETYPSYPRSQWEGTRPSVDHDSTGNFMTGEEPTRGSLPGARAAMVNNGNYPSYAHPQWEGNRPVADNVPNDNSFMAAEESTRSPLPCTVPKALSEYCHIETHSFFLAVDTGGGNMVYYGGPHSLTEEQISKMFKRDKFLQFQRENRSPTYEGGPYDDGLGHMRGGLNPAIAHFDNRSERSKRKRRMLRYADDDDVPVVSSAKKPLTIGNAEQVKDFYVLRFKCVQQTACKNIGKAFIRAIAPKKQATNPYTGGDATAPDWWPKPWGAGERDKVRHREPDHLWKRERLVLLPHILKLVIDNEHPDIRRLNVTVAQLEQRSMEILSAWFADNAHPNNAKKEGILKELFKVAKMEERYKRGEIDASTQVFVRADDLVMDYCSGEINENDEEEEARGVAETQLSRTVSPTSNSQIMAAQMQGGQFMSDLAARGHQFGASTMMQPVMAPEQYPTYPEGASLAAAPLQAHDMLPSPHHQHPDPASRRSSVFSSPPVYSASPSPSAIYHPWTQQQQQQQQQTPTTVTGSPSSLYAYTPVHHQQQTGTSPPASLPLPHHPQHHQSLPNPYAAHQQHQQQLPNPYTPQQALPTLQMGYVPATTGGGAQTFDGLPSTAQQQQHSQQQQQHNQHGQTVFRGGSIHLALGQPQQGQQRQ